MAAMINLNTSLNQHSLPQKFVFYLYVKVLLGNIFCFDLMLLWWIPVNVTCIIVIVGTIWMFFFWHSTKLISQKFRHL